MKKLLFILFLLITTPAWAVTDFAVTIKDSGGDWTTYSAAESALTNALDLTVATTKVFSFDANSGTIPDGTACTTDGGSSTGTCVHQSVGGQILIENVSGSFDDNDVVTDGTNTVTLSNSGDSAGITLTVHKNITDGTWDGGTYDSTNYMVITGDTTNWDGKGGGIQVTASGWGSFRIGDAGVTIKNLVLICDNSACLMANNNETLTAINIILNGGGVMPAYTSSVTCINCYSYDSVGNCFDMHYDGSVIDCYNCTCINAAGDGFDDDRSWGGGEGAFNSISLGCAGDDWESSWTTGDYNGCSDTSCDDFTTNYQNLNLANNIVDGGNGDPHQKAGNVLESAGNDYSATTGVDYDIDNTTVTNWTIGVDEYDAQTPADTTNPVISNEAPSATLALGTTETTMSLDTDETAVCKYGTTASTAFASIANEFTTTRATAHSVTLTGLTDGSSTDYYIRCCDYNKNCHTTDTTITVAVADDTSAPNQIDNLAISTCDYKSCDLTWTAVGDDGATGTATSYDIRYSTSAINAGNWADATQDTNEPTPKASGQAETYTLEGLTEETTYHIAIKAVDDASNSGALSNVPSDTTTARTTITNVWANSGEYKVPREDTPMADADTDVYLNNWWDGTTVSVSGAKNEVTAFSIYIEASGESIDDIIVEFDTLTNENNDTIETSVSATGDEVFDYVNRNIEVFYVRYLQIKGLSSNCWHTFYDERHMPERFRRTTPAVYASYDDCPEGVGVPECRGSGGWTDRPDADKYYPDIAVPNELITNFDVANGESQQIWVDVYIPKTAEGGTTYTGNFLIKKGATTLRTIPVSLSVRNFTLPDDTDVALGWLDYSMIDERHYSDEHGAITTARDLTYDQYYKLFWRHRVALFEDGEDISGAASSDFTNTYGVHIKDVLDGTLFGSGKGYAGPMADQSMPYYMIGMYGKLYAMLGYGDYGPGAGDATRWKYYLAEEAEWRTDSDVIGDAFATYAPDTTPLLYLGDTEGSFSKNTLAYPAPDPDVCWEPYSNRWDDTNVQTNCCGGLDPRSELVAENDPPYDHWATSAQGNFAFHNTWCNYLIDNPGNGSRIKCYSSTIDRGLYLCNQDQEIFTISGWYGKVDGAETYRDWAIAQSKELWQYNGGAPLRGTFATEDDGTSLIAHMWGAHRLDIDTSWFWVVNGWYNARTNCDTTPSKYTDVFGYAHTFGPCWTSDTYGLGGNGTNDFGNGDGVLVYPGTDTRYSGSNYGRDGGFASLRLKLWRRGIQDYLYLQMAEEVDSVTTTSIVNTRVPMFAYEVCDEYCDPDDPTYMRAGRQWSNDPDVWDDSRTQIANIIQGEPAVVGGTTMGQCTLQGATIN